MILALLRAGLEDYRQARRGNCCICRRQITAGHLCDDCRDAL